LVKPWSHIPYIPGVLFFSAAIAVVGGAFASYGWGLSRAGIAVFAIGTVAISLAIAVTGVADVHHGGNGSSASSGGSQQAGLSVDSFCTELRNLWDDGGVMQAVRDVDNGYRYSRGTPNATSRGDLQTAATNAQKLADDTPAGANGGGGDVKKDLTNAAKALSAAAAGHGATSGGADETVIEWQGFHCP
jgi:hypothetical protein